MDEGLGETFRDESFTERFAVAGSVPPECVMVFVIERLLQPMPKPGGVRRAGHVDPDLDPSGNIARAGDGQFGGLRMGCGANHDVEPYLWLTCQVQPRAGFGEGGEKVIGDRGQGVASVQEMVGPHLHFPTRGQRSIGREPAAGKPIR